jgi:hypothetical protein
VAGQMAGRMAGQMAGLMAGQMVLQMAMSLLPSASEHGRWQQGHTKGFGSVCISRKNPTSSGSRGLGL